MASLVIYTSLALLFYILYRKLVTQKLPAPYPPGPPPDPIIGNARHVPSSEQMVYFDKLRNKYGDIVHLEILGKHIIVLASLKVASDLLDKRGLQYSSRPRMVMFTEVLGGDPVLAFMPYDEKGKRHRVLLTSPFTRSAVNNYIDIQTRETQILLQNLIQKPDKFSWYIRKFVTAVIMEITYAHRVIDDGDHYIDLAENLSSAMANCGTPGAAPPDIFPFLKHVPSWVPGAWWSRYGDHHRPKVRAMFDVPFEGVQKQIKEGTARPSFLYDHLETLKDTPEIATPEYMEELKGVCATIYGAGAETTWSTFLTFFYYLIKHPEHQARAQQEIDRVVGIARLPELNDRESLPFVEAVLQETMRIYPVSPLGVPHVSTEDDIYNGYFIPKGAVVLASAYSMGRDPAIYSDPATFNPTRYLPKPEGNAEPYPAASWGFGRRICPGRYLADQQLFLVASHVLATLNVSAYIGPDGKPEELDPEFLSQLSCHPKPYRCTITPRSAKTEMMIAEAVANAA